MFFPTTGHTVGERHKGPPTARHINEGTNSTVSWLIPWVLLFLTIDQPAKRTYLQYIYALNVREGLTGRCWSGSNQRATHHTRAWLLTGCRWTKYKFNKDPMNSSWRYTLESVIVLNTYPPLYLCFVEFSPTKKPSFPARSVCKYTRNSYYEWSRRDFFFLFFRTTGQLILHARARTPIFPPNK